MKIEECQCFPCLLLYIFYACNKNCLLKKSLYLSYKQNLVGVWRFYHTSVSELTRMRVDHTVDITVRQFPMENNNIFIYEGCSEIIETPAVIKFIKMLQILFLVVRYQNISADKIQVIERLRQIFQSQDKPERREPLVPGAL